MPKANIVVGVQGMYALAYVGILYFSLGILHSDIFTGVQGMYALAWVSYIIFAFSVSLVRQAAREKLNIAGTLNQLFLGKLANE